MIGRSLRFSLTRQCCNIEVEVEHDSSAANLVKCSAPGLRPDLSVMNLWAVFLSTHAAYTWIAGLLHALTLRYTYHF